jgi:hypothetical protein
VAIFEVGIMRNGMLLINRTYYEEIDDTIRIRRTQILNAITTLASILLKDSVKFIKFDKLMVGIYIFENEDALRVNLAKDNPPPVTVFSSIKDTIQPETDGINNGDEDGIESTFDDVPPCIAKDNISAYCIGDLQMLENQIFTLLRQITKVFIRKFQPTESNGSYVSTNGYENTDKYASFTNEIDKILKDIQYTPIDRLKLGIL